MYTFHQLFRWLIAYIKNGTLIATLCTKSCIILIIALIFSLDLYILHWNHKPAQYKYVHTYQGCHLICDVYNDMKIIHHYVEEV